MKVSDSLMVDAQALLSDKKDAVAQAKRIVSISCSGCGAGCSGIVGD